jgi:hypothetical protein
MRVVRLFSAAVALEPVALAPAKPETAAVYSPSDSSTLPEYCLPSTVVEKLVAASTSCTAALLLPPPPPELECDVVVEVVALAVVLVAAVWVASEAVAVVVEEVAVDLAVDTGFNTVRLDALDEDEIEPISMIFPGSKRTFLKLVIGGLIESFRNAPNSFGFGARRATSSADTRASALIHWPCKRNAIRRPHD